jgi:integrase
MRGHIRKRGRSWAVVVYLGKNDHGKDRYRWYSHPTKRDAEAHLTGLLMQVNGGAGVPTSRLTTSAFLALWLRDYAKGRIRATSYSAYERAVRVHIVPDLGAIPIARLTALAIEGWIARMGRKTYLPPTKNGTAPMPRHLSAATVHQAYRTLRAALGRAVGWGMIARNPFVGVTAPRLPRKPMHLWDEEQIRLFLAEARRTSPCAGLYLAAILTGMRRGELLALRWEDIDLALRRASVQRTLHRAKDGVTFADVKTPCSRRAVALPEVLVLELRRIKEAQAARREALGALYAPHGLVFCQPNGQPLHAHNVTQRDFRKVIMRAGVPRIRFHDLRHCCATLLLRYGVHARVTQEMLGHANIGTTMNTYSHVMAPALVEASTLLAERLLGDSHLQAFAKR